MLRGMLVHKSPKRSKKLHPFCLAPQHHPRKCHYDLHHNKRQINLHKRSSPPALPLAHLRPYGLPQRRPPLLLPRLINSKVRKHPPALRASCPNTIPHRPTQRSDHPSHHNAHDPDRRYPPQRLPLNLRGRSPPWRGDLTFGGTHRYAIWRHRQFCAPRTCRPLRRRSIVPNHKYPLAQNRPLRYGIRTRH